MTDRTLKPVAYARRWFVDGRKPCKVKGDDGRWRWPFEFKLNPLTQIQCLADDVPLVPAPTDEEIRRIRDKWAATTVPLGEKPSADVVAAIDWAIREAVSGGRE